jgi:hypothetical protein
VDASPRDAALELRSELIEILKQLNRAEMEEGDVPGLEASEVHHFLSKGPLPQVTSAEVAEALKVLIGNGLARELDDPEYAWDRGRVVADRYTITTEGKEFLLRQIQRVGRV